MKKIKEWAVEMGGALIFVLILGVCLYGLSWIVTCGLIKLITLCFGWTFSWVTATGVWLIILILTSVFKSTTHVHK